MVQARILAYCSVHEAGKWNPYPDLTSLKSGIQHLTSLGLSVLNCEIRTQEVQWTETGNQSEMGDDSAYELTWL